LRPVTVGNHNQAMLCGVSMPLEKKLSSSYRVANLSGWVDARHQPTRPGKQAGAGPAMQSSNYAHQINRVFSAASCAASSAAAVTHRAGSWARSIPTAPVICWPSAGIIARSRATRGRPNLTLCTAPILRGSVSLHRKFLLVLNHGWPMDPAQIICTVIREI